MIKQFVFAISSSVLLLACSNVTMHNTEKSTSCQVGEFSKADLHKLKETEFKGLTDQAVNQFALDLTSCVGNSDPEIRDGIVFESFSFLLRNDKLNDATKHKLVTALLGSLSGTEDKGGYLKPFAALDLSELVRADRIDPYLTDLQRAELVTATVEYMSEIRDYRGYNDKQGWRHGVAHAADLTLHLVLNDQIIEPQLRALRGAIATQISPEKSHAYIHGESERLARPILYMARRSAFSQAEWYEWFLSIVDPSPFDAWGDVFKSEIGLAKLHNTKAFLNSVYVNASASQDENVRVLVGSSLAALKKLP